MWVIGGIHFLAIILDERGSVPCLKSRVPHGPTLTYYSPSDSTFGTGNTFSTGNGRKINLINLRVLGLAWRSRTGGGHGVGSRWEAIALRVFGSMAGNSRQSKFQGINRRGVGIFFFSRKSWTAGGRWWIDWQEKIQKSRQGTPNSRAW